MSAHTPLPWTWIDQPGAGIEIFAPVSLVEAVELPFKVDDPLTPINIFGLTKPANFQIGYGRWVQFEPKGWHDMQIANAQRIVAFVNACEGINPEAVPEMLEACKAVVENLLGLVVDRQRLVDICINAIAKAEDAP